MSYLTRPSNVRVYQFRQPPGWGAASAGTCPLEDSNP